MTADSSSLARIAPADLANSNTASRPPNTGTSNLAESSVTDQNQFLSTTGPEDIFRPAPLSKPRKNTISIPFFRRKRAASHTAKPIITTEEVVPKISVSGKPYGQITLLRANTPWSSTYQSDSNSHDSVKESRTYSHYNGDGSADSMIRTQTISTSTSQQLSTARSQSSNRSRESFPCNEDDANTIDEKPSVAPALQQYVQTHAPLTHDKSAITHPSLWPLPRPRHLETTTYMERARTRSFRAERRGPESSTAAVTKPDMEKHVNNAEKVASTAQHAGQKQNQIDLSHPAQRITSFLRQETALRSTIQQEATGSTPAAQAASSGAINGRPSTESSFSDVLDFGPDDQGISPILLCNAVTQRSLSLPQTLWNSDRPSPAPRRSLGEAHSSMAQELQKLGERNRYLEATIATLLADKESREIHQS